MKQGNQFFLYKKKVYRIMYVRSVNETFKGKNMMTKSERLVEALKSGDQLTAAQIKARFGIANPTATVSDLRLRGGFAVYANEHKDTKGRVTVKYRLGTPSRAVVAAGYRALAQAAE
jgi:predicted ArsR family transcriptional regulator